MTADPSRTRFWQREIQLTRKVAHIFFALVVWPLLTVVGATLAIVSLPYVSVSLLEAMGASVAGTLLSGLDMLVAGGVCFGLSHFIFDRFGTHTRDGRFDSARLALEPLLMLIAITAGVSLWYPAVLGQPLLLMFGGIPAAGVEALFAGGVVLGACFVADRGKRSVLAAWLIAAGVLSPVPLLARSALEPFFGHRPDVVILGIDSVSYDDAAFNDWVHERGGVWYERAVAPGLLTNSVWASILTMTPVREHGVFHTFQPLPSVPPALISRAREKGYRTVSVFTDQFTCAVGSRAGFDENRSGPAGWRQLLLGIVADNSLLVPLLRPVLPRVWPSFTPPNHAGTYTYDLRREIRGIFRAGAKEQRTLVAAHINYAHHPAYPSTRDLSWQELLQIAQAPAASLSDRTFDWQDRDEESDPVKLHVWKLKHLQDVITDEVDASRYLGEGRRLVMFSDHGDRAGLELETFADRRYYHVPLATFGVPAQCPREPISLIDIGALLELSDGHAAPSVEFTMAPKEQWLTLLQTSRIRLSGDVDLDRDLLAEVLAGLRRHDPWGVASRNCSATASGDNPNHSKRFEERSGIGR